MKQELIEILLDAHNHLLLNANIVSIDYRPKRVAGKKTDRNAFVVGVVKKKEDPELSDDDIVIPSVVRIKDADDKEHEIETDVLEEGVIKSHAVDGGTTLFSQGSPGPGTLGVNIQYQGAYNLLSNAHVLTQYDSNRIGSPIYSPAVIQPSNLVADVTGQQPVKYYPQGQNPPNPFYNTFDFAWANISPNVGNPQIINIGIPAGFTAPAVNQDILFYGGSSGLQATFIESINARYRSFGYDLHRNPIVEYWQNGITYGAFVTAGDSGAALVNQDVNNNLLIVGLHRGGGNFTGYGCPIP